MLLLRRLWHSKRRIMIWRLVGIPDLQSESLFKHYADGGLIFRTNSFDDFCRSIARDLRNAEQQNTTIRISIKQLTNIYFLCVYTMQYNRFTTVLKLYEIWYIVARCILVVKQYILSIVTFHLKITSLPLNFTSSNLYRNLYRFRLEKLFLESYISQP